ncbi:hypothetical protein Scep_000081 [Stephania cephalantha]|uniref:MLO-like protein n=1 Tax=Stephania cephalantha TaxID=152367 RepID=A0AAP0Q2L2_9MAGN
MAAGGGDDRSLKDTPTWAVAIVCAAFVIISVIIELGIHSLGKFFQRRQKKAMSEALEKIKAELMLLGFISLLLTFAQQHIAKICMPAKYGKDMLPCRAENSKSNGGKKDGDTGDFQGDDRRKLLWIAQDVISRRSLAAAAGNTCGENKIPLVSQTALHQLHIFIFVLAVFHVLYSVITMALAQAKVAFLRQFFGSITKVDYLTMRHGFINILLLVGTKLELVIMEMAQQIQDRTTVVKGAPTVEPSNKLFWFNRPEWILFLIHFTLFQMGSHMKKAIFEEQTAKALAKWRKAAKERKKMRRAGGDMSSGFMSGENTPSIGSSPVHLLHKYKTTSVDIESVPNSPRSYQSETDLSETELPSPVAAPHDRLPRRQENQNVDADQIHNGDFSFVKL